MRLIVWLIVGLVLLAPLPRASANDVETVVGLLEFVLETDTDAARQCLRTLTTKVQSGELSALELRQLEQRLQPVVDPVLKKSDHTLFMETSLLAASLGNSTARGTVEQLARDGKQTLEVRRASWDALALAKVDEVLPLAERLLQDATTPAPLKSHVMASLGRYDDERIAEYIVVNFNAFDAELQPKAIDLLIQRASWGKALVKKITEKTIPAHAVSVSQVLRLKTAADEELQTQIRSLWGNVRAERNPQREQVVAAMRQTFAQGLGDANQGAAVFQKVCGQCHKIHGVGQEVGPDITANGRASFEQLLSNVFDPNLVIGDAYQPRTVVLDDGRVLTGLLAEDNEQRVVLKLPGGKLETIARSQVEEMQPSKLSLMPEGLETQLKPEELLDLFAFLAFDKPPSDPAARTIPGAPSVKLQR